MDDKKPKNRKQLIVVAVVVLLVLVVVAAVVGNNNKTSAPTRTASITISSDGFQPATLTVQKDTKVTWVNTDSKGHSVGANPYPSHDSLKALVSTALIQGQTYSYTFTKSGTYHYHDDLNPTLNASVTVE